MKLDPANTAMKHHFLSITDPELTIQAFYADPADQAKYDLTRWELECNATAV